MFKLIASCNNFVKLAFTANVCNVDDKRVPRLRQRNFVSVMVAVVRLISEKDIDVVIRLSEIVSCTDIKTMEY